MTALAALWRIDCRDGGLQGDQIEGHYSHPSGRRWCWLGLGRWHWGEVAEFWKSLEVRVMGSFWSFCASLALTECHGSPEPQDESILCPWWGRDGKKRQWGIQYQG